MTAPTTIYIRFTEDGTLLRKWSADPFEGATEFRAVEVPFASVADADGWITWGGGECPIPKGTRFQVELRCDPPSRRGLQPFHSNPEKWFWENRGAAFDIVAYRVVRP